CFCPSLRTPTNQQALLRACFQWRVAPTRALVHTTAVVVGASAHTDIGLVRRAQASGTRRPLLLMESEVATGTPDSSVIECALTSAMTVDDSREQQIRHHTSAPIRQSIRNKLRLHTKGCSTRCQARLESQVNGNILDDFALMAGSQFSHRSV